MAQEEVKISFTIDGIEKQVSSVEELQKEVAKLGKEAKKTGKELEKAGGGGGKMSKGLAKIGSIGKAAFKGIGTAIKASGIGLLVGVVAKLVEQFTKTDTGAKILQGSMAVLGVIFEQVQVAVEWLIDNLVGAFTNPQQAVEDLRAGVQRLGDWFSSLGDYIKNNFILLLQKMQAKVLEARIAWNEFTGDSEEAEALKAQLESINEEIDNTKMAITEAAEEVQAPFIAAANFIKETVTTIVEQSKQAIAASNASIEAANQFAALQNRLIVENAELTKQLEEQKKIAEDTTRAYDERKEALDKVNEANEKLVANALLEAQANENLIRQQLSIVSNDEDRRELQAELAAATAERIAREQEAEIVRLESAKLNAELDQEELDRKQTIRDILKEMELEDIENEFARQQEELNAAQTAAIEELNRLRATEEEKARVNEYYSNQKKKLKKAEADYEMALQRQVNEANLEVASQALGAIGKLVGEGTAAGKAAAIAQTTIDTYLGAQKAYTSQLIPGDPTSIVRAQIAAGVAIAGGLANVKAILSTKTPEGGGGGGGSTPSQPTIPSFDPTAGLAEAGEGQDIGNVVGPGGQQNGQGVIKAYVVAEEMTSQQEANQKIEDLARL